jgi:hypothetical protein
MVVACHVSQGRNRESLVKNHSARRGQASAFCHAPSRQPDARHGSLAYACERLERRTLLSTVSIAGTSGPDTWTIEADAGSYTLNGTPVSAPGMDAMVFNGLDNNDQLVISHTTIPITFNGGNGNDNMSAGNGQVSQQVLVTCTFNGGAGIDTAEAREENNNLNTNFTVSSSTVSWGSAALNWDTTIDGLNVYTGTTGSTVTIGALFTPVIITVIGNNDASETVNLAMNGSSSLVAFNGGTGVGVDSLVIMDDAIGPLTYTVNSTTVSRSGRTVSYSGLESISLAGTASQANTFNVSGGASTTSLALIGGNASDSFALTAALFGNVSITGGVGSVDALTVDDRTQPFVMNAVTLGTTTMARDYMMGGPQTYNLTYGGIEAWTYFAANHSTSINVTGTPASLDVGQQATIICGGNSDTVTLYPHDVNGNLTINGNLGVVGGSGTDKVLVDDTGSANGITYDFQNTFGPGTQNIYGLGTRGFGAASDVETIEVRGGNGNDTFNLNTWQSGAALVVNDGSGFDNFFISPTAHSLSAAITNMTFFSYDGGLGCQGDPGGFNHFRIWNDANSSAWTVTRTSTAISYSSGSYFVVLNLANVDWLLAYGGTQADQFNVRSTPAEEMDNDFDGAGGNDNYTFGNLGLTSGIASECFANGAAGTDSIIVDDSADTVGRTVHVEKFNDFSTVNAYPTDTLFPSLSRSIFGSVGMGSMTGTVTVKLGNGADTISFPPVTLSTYIIQGGNPTTSPGDTLKLAFAAATSPVFTPGGTGAGSYTFSNRKPMSYTGIETKTIDSVAPTVLAQHFDPATSTMSYQFSEDVGPALFSTGFRMKNLNTGGGVNFDNIEYNFDTSTNTASYAFPGLPGGVLPDAAYLATLSEATDQAGNVMTGAGVSYTFIYSNGTNGPDAFRVAVNAAGTMTEVYHNDDVTPAFAADFSSLNLIALAGGEDDDSFVVDTSNGNPHAAEGLVLDGGNGTDSLRVLVTDLVDTVSFTSGAVLIDGGPVAHPGLESLAYTGGDADHYVALAVDAGSVTVNGTDRFETLSIGDGAAVFAEPGNSTAVVVRALSVTGTGVFDLADNSLILPDASVPAVQALLAAGYNAGHWNGNGGLNSSTAAASTETSVGFASNASLNLTEFKGVTGLTANDVLVKYTYAGDANLDGKVDIGDLGLLAGAWQQSGKTWFDGDFTYNGIVDIGDLGLLAGNWQKGVGNPL